MLAIGFCYLVAVRQGASPSISRHERIALPLCAYGLIAEIVTAGVGFFGGNMIWPNFYFEPVPTGKNVFRSAGTQHPRLFRRRLLCGRRRPPSIGPISMTHLSGTR
jgi:hypothetical protein